MANGGANALGGAAAVAPGACGNNPVGSSKGGCGGAGAGVAEPPHEVFGIGDEPPAPVPATPVGPLITVAKPYVLVHKPYIPDAKAVRTKVHLTTDAAFDGTGTLTVATGADSEAELAFYDAEHNGNLVFEGGSNSFSGDALTIGVDLWAQGVSPSTALNDIQLELRLSGGTKPVKPPVRERLTSVEVTLDLCKSRAALGADPAPLSDGDKVNTGRFVHIQKAQHHGRALLIVRKAQPADFPGTLVLRRDNAKVRVFNDEVPAAGQAATALPHDLPNPGIAAAGQKFWVEGLAVSGALRDTGFKLGVQGLTTDNGDWVKVTVVQLSRITASVPSTPPNTQRQGNGPVGRHTLRRGSAPNHYHEDFDRNRPLVLVENSTEDVQLSLTVQPANIPFSWTIERARQPGTANPLDHADIVNLSFGSTPQLDPTDAPSATATLNTSATGSFHVRAYVDCNDSGTFQGDDPATGQRVDREPFALLNYVVVRVQGFENTSRAHSPNISVNGGGALNAATGVAISTGNFASGPTAAVHNRAKITVIGGGPHGKLGLSELFAGWANNIQDSHIFSEYVDTAPPAVHRFERLIFARNNPDVPHPGMGLFRAPALPAPAGVVSSAAAPQIVAMPVLDVTNFAGAGRGGNTCVGTEGAPGPPAAIQKRDLPNATHALTVGQDWYVQQWDSPGLGANPTATMHPATRLIAFQFFLDFRCDLVVWTNVARVRGNTGDAACRLYSTVQTDIWTIRYKVNFNAAGVANVAVPGRIQVRRDADPTRQAAPVEDGDLEVRFPVALDLYCIDARV